MKRQQTLNEEKGKAVARGEDVVITSDDLTPYSNGNYIRKCPNCGKRE